MLFRSGYSVEWVTRLLKHMSDNRLTFMDATQQGVDDWTAHVHACGEGLLSNEVDSWMTGINSNIDGKNTRIIARYSGSAPAYREKADAVADGGFKELVVG